MKLKNKFDYSIIPFFFALKSDKISKLSNNKISHFFHCSSNLTQILKKKNVGKIVVSHPYWKVRRFRKY